MSSKRRGRFSHPRSERRFWTSGIAVVAAQTFALNHDGEISLGVYEDDETEGRRQLFRVAREPDGAVVTTQIARAIREEPEMAAVETTGRKKSTDEIAAEAAVAAGTDALESGATEDEISEAAVAAAETAVEKTTKKRSGSTKPKATGGRKAAAKKATPRATSNGEVDREKYVKRLRPKIAKATAFEKADEQRLDAVLKYAVRMALHKDGLRTKPTDFARHGLSKADVEALSEIV